MTGAWAQLEEIETALRDARVGLTYYEAPEGGRQLGFDRVWGPKGRGFGLVLRADGRSRALLDVDEEETLVGAAARLEAFLDGFTKVIEAETVRVQQAVERVQTVLRAFEETTG